MQFFDLNSTYPKSSYNPPHLCMRRVKDEFRENGLCSTDSASTTVRVQAMRPSLSWQSQGQKFLMHGPVSLHGVCPTDLSRKLARHRNVSQFPSTEALSHGLSREDRQIHAGRRQRTAGLPHLSGLRLSAHRHRQQTLSERGAWPRPEALDLCAGLNDHRSLPIHLPVGNVSEKESGSQDSHVTQRANINSDLYFRDSREYSRRQYDGCCSCRSRFGLYDGPGLSRFRGLYQINQLSAFFVIPSKRNTRLRRIYSAPVDKTIGVQADQTVLLVGYKSRLAYPDPFRRIRYHDVERDKRLVFLTNNFLVPAKTVADIICHDGRWSYSSNGSNNTFASSRSLERHPTRSKHKSGPQSVFICSWRLSRSD